MHVAIAWQLIWQLHYPVTMVQAHGRLTYIGLWPTFFSLHSDTFLFQSHINFLSPTHPHLYSDRYTSGHVVQIWEFFTMLGQGSMPVQAFICCWPWHLDGSITFMHSYLLRWHLCVRHIVVWTHSLGNRLAYIGGTEDLCGSYGFDKWS